jgi:hypothetical protein
MFPYNVPFWNFERPPIFSVLAGKLKKMELESSEEICTSESKITEVLNESMTKTPISSSTMCELQGRELFAKDTPEVILLDDDDVPSQHHSPVETMDCSSPQKVAFLCCQHHWFDISSSYMIY